jgi:hypothetical protein
VDRTVRWLEGEGRLKNSDEDTFEDELIAAWQRKPRRYHASQQRNEFSGWRNRVLNGIEYSIALPTWSE